MCYVGLFVCERRLTVYNGKYLLNAIILVYYNIWYNCDVCNVCNVCNVSAIPHNSNNCVNKCAYNRKKESKSKFIFSNKSQSMFKYKTESMRDLLSDRITRCQPSVSRRSAIHQGCLTRICQWQSIFDPQSHRQRLRWLHSARISSSYQSVLQAFLVIQVLTRSIAGAPEGQLALMQRCAVSQSTQSSHSSRSMKQSRYSQPKASLISLCRQFIRRRAGALQQRSRS